MTVGVVQFPGTNCERETGIALKRAGLEPVFVLWNEPEERLRALDAYVLAGGFSYEDRSRSGVIAALDPVMTVIAEENRRGKPVMGICNGAQILVESGLVPGEGGPPVALTTNKRVRDGRILGTGFYNAWVTLRAERSASPPEPGGAEPRDSDLRDSDLRDGDLRDGDSPVAEPRDSDHRDADSSGTARPQVFTSVFNSGDLIRIPAAHAEGRFVMSDEALAEIELHGLVAFRYADDTGRADPEFPVNPNGSRGNIAALTSYDGTVMAIMPHPERTDRGNGIFTSLRCYLETRVPGETADESARKAADDSVGYRPGGYRTAARQDAPASHPAGTSLLTSVTHQAPAAPPTPASLSKYQPAPGAQEVLVKLIITDNTAVSVENALAHRGIDAEIRRYVHWEIGLDRSLSRERREELLKRIHAAGELYNDNKERPLAAPGAAGGPAPGDAFGDSLGNSSGDAPDASAFALLVREREDVAGTRVRQALVDWFGCDGLADLKRGILWTIRARRSDRDETVQAVLQSNILMNPVAQEGLLYG